mmetsp:Transcript_65575/g.75435  ORF Transcript_65575/g.75435 Transcript_65575/m.75435 type:complete len:172 (-) Transcript_65575:636-1151(-)
MMQSRWWRGGKVIFYVSQELGAVAIAFVLLFPGITIKKLIQYFDTLSEDVIKQRWGVLFEEFDQLDRKAVLYYPLHLIWSLAFGFMVCILEWNPALQMFLWLSLCVVRLICILKFSPYMHAQFNRSNKINETLHVITVLGTMTFLFSESTLDWSLREIIGTVIGERFTLRR